MSTEHRSGVVVTLGTIYDTLLRIGEDVTVTKERVGTLRADVDHHDTRITTLERRTWPLPSLSILVALGALAAALLRG